MRRSLSPLGDRLFARVHETLARTEYRMASTSDDFELIARLRYQAYRREGAIGLLPSRALIDRFDENENARVFGIFIDGTLAASIRIHVVTPSSPFSPAMEAFPELHDLAFAGNVARVVIDPNRFVADQAMSARFPALPFVALRLPFIASDIHGAEMATATVRSEHESFYAKVLGYRRICPPRPYPTLVKDLGLMVVDFAKMREQVLRRYPFFQELEGEAHRLFRAPHRATEFPANRIAAISAGAFA